MLQFASRLAAFAAASGAVLALSACGVASPGADAPPPPPQAYTPPPAASSQLAGGPPPARGLAGGPRKPGRGATMAPIPNPEDMSPADRARIYPHYRGGSGHAAVSHKPLRTWTRADGRTVVAMSPVANPEDMSPRERRKVYGRRYDPAPAPHAAVQPRPHVVAAAPAKPATVAAPKPVAVAPKPAPVITPAPAKPAAVAAAPVAAAAAAVAPAAPAKPALDPKLAKLQAAVGPAAVNGATLTVADSVTQGSPGKVTLTLAPDLFDIIKREAAKLGLTKAAKKTDVTATLTGDGYTVQPNGAQTAHLKSGEAAKFDWLVTPGAGEKGPLTASVDASLNGAGKPQTFSLATIQRAIAPPAAPEAPKAKRSAFELPDVLSIPGMKTVNLPGVGAVPSKNVVTAVIALIIVLLLIMVARGNNAAREREERRRKFRALSSEEPAAEPAAHAETHHEPVSYSSGYSPPLTFADPDPAPQHQTNYVNPMIAAAAGAAAGAAAMHAHDEHAHAETAHVEPVSEPHAEAHAAPVSHDHHDDHGHAEEAHVEDGHHADGHGHDDHGHDGHGHDDHAHVEHTAHAREPEHA